MLTTNSTEQIVVPFNYKKATEAILANLRRDRDRKIIARRFGLGIAKRQTLEKIGKDFNITRERVRQIEKAAISKMRTSLPAEAAESNRVLVSYLEQEGGIARAEDIASKMGADTAGERAYVLLLATLAPDVDLHDDSDEHEATLALNAHYDRTKILRLINHVVETIKNLGKPQTLNIIMEAMTTEINSKTLENLGKIAKRITNLDNLWGLSAWPEVNPRSIRDKTYIVLKQKGRPMHFADIAEEIRNLKLNQRQVTVQAVHNELIKDPRFVLIGRGIYALAEWGYTPGTVADIIVDILKNESPLHKDEIVRRVLEKRQVKTATIILNLQEKDQFVRVAKATYALKE